MGEMSGSISIERAYVKMGNEAKKRQVLGELFRGELYWAKSIELKGPEDLLIEFARKLGEIHFTTCFLCLKWHKQQI